MGPHGYLEIPRADLIEGAMVESMVKDALRNLARSGNRNALYDVEAGIKYELHATEDGRAWVYFETQPRF